MPELKKNNIVAITYSDIEFGEEYLKRFSEELLKEFSLDDLNRDEISDSISFAFRWYLNEFTQCLNNINEVAFYQAIFWLHEQSSQVFTDENYIFEYNKVCSTDFAMYRRIFKIILEYACELELSNSVRLCRHYFEEQIPKFEKILFLGNIVLICFLLFGFYYFLLCFIVF